MMNFRFQATRFYKGGEPILNAHVRKLAKEYTPPDYIHGMEGTILGTTFLFTLEKERRDPNSWLARELGPAVLFSADEKDQILEAISPRSASDFQLKPQDDGGYYATDSGTFRHGKPICDFTVLAVKRAETKMPTDVSVSAVESIGRPNPFYRCY
jgi:hypothetical protein